MKTTRPASRRTLGGNWARTPRRGDAAWPGPAAISLTARLRSDAVAWPGRFPADDQAFGESDEAVGRHREGGDGDDGEPDQRNIEREERVHHHDAEAAIGVAP